MSKTHMHTHTYTHNKKQQREKKRIIQIFKVPSVSLSLGECAGACECVHDRICMSVALKVCPCTITAILRPEIWV